MNKKLKQGINLQNGKGLLQRPIRIEVAKLLAGVIASAVHGTLATAGTPGSGERAGVALAKTIEAFSLEGDPAGQAVDLISKALVKSIETICQEAVGFLPDGEKPSFDYTLLKDEYLEISLTPNFLTKPESEVPIDSLAANVANLLSGAGLPKAIANNFAKRLPSYFVYALDETWRSDRGKYEEFFSALESPFSHATESSSAWDRYSLFLRRQVNESLFGESFTLAQMYIPLRGYYAIEVEENFASDKRVTRTQRKIVSLHEAINQWINGNDRDDSIRIICGGPGSGKSSSAKMLAHDLTRDGTIKCLFVPLHFVNLKGDLTASVGQFLAETSFFHENLIEAQNLPSRLLVIFDGLDELADQGRIGKETALKFIRILNEKLRNANAASHGQPRLLALITGRDIIVQEVESDFRREGQIIHVIPYYVDEDEASLYFDPQDLLKRDQRSDWWRAYGKAVGGDYTDIPDVLRKPGLTEITSQPLLNYLVALSFRRGAIDFASDINLNVVYDDLLSSVFERDYERRKHVAASQLSSEQFRFVLEEIAVSTWHGNGRTATVAQIEEHCKGTAAERILNKFQEDAQNGVARLLTAFYFRKHDGASSDEQTFEFTHKSFGEYLMARRIVRGVRKIVDERNRQRTELDGGWTERAAVSYWVKLCGPSPVDRYLHPFIEREIDLLSANDRVEFQSASKEILQYFITAAPPPEAFPLGSNIRVLSAWSNNAENAILIIHACCATHTGIVSRLIWPETDSAAKFFARRRGSFYNLQESPVRESMHHLDFSEQTLYATFLHACNCSYSVFDKCHMNDSVLIMGNFEGASFSFARLNGSDLIRANFENSNFKGTNLSNTRLYGANLKNAILSRAIFDEDESEKSDSGLNWRDADLDGLPGSSLRWLSQNFPKV